MAKTNGHQNFTFANIPKNFFLSASVSDLVGLCDDILGDSNIGIVILLVCVMIFWGDSNIGLVILLVPPNALRRLQ